MRAKWRPTALSKFTIVWGIGLLFALSGCDSLVPVSIQSPMSADTPIPPPPEESNLEVAGLVLPATPEPYVPPPTQPPWPTAEPVPTETPRPTLEEGRVVQGSGNFPRVPVVAVASDGQTLALYLLQGGTARQLVAFGETNHYSDHITVRLSPSGRYLAYQISYGMNGGTTLEVVDTQDPRRIVLYRDTSPHGKGDPPSARLTSLAWLDEEHLMYTMMQPGKCSEDPTTGPSCEMPGELWVTDLNGEKRLLLAADRLWQVTGASPDGGRAYFQRLMPSCQPGAQTAWGSLHSLDLASGMTMTLWPHEEDLTEYLEYRIVTRPDGNQRAFISPWASDATFLMLNLDTGQAATFAGDGDCLSDPGDFTWSPHSEEAFIYTVAGHTDRVDVSSGQVQTLIPKGWPLLAWAEEGIVIQWEDTVELWDEAGQLQGQIQFAP